MQTAFHCFWYRQLHEAVVNCSYSFFVEESCLRCQICSIYALHFTVDRTHLRPINAASHVPIVMELLIALFSLNYPINCFTWRISQTGWTWSSGTLCLITQSSLLRKHPKLSSPALMWVMAFIQGAKITWLAKNRDCILRQCVIFGTCHTCKLFH